MTKSLQDIAAERHRQIVEEGRTAEHDDGHKGGSLAAAAGCYALSAAGTRTHALPRTAINIPMAWPWDNRWWKPRSAREDLVRAGALIVAETDRLDRIAAKAAA